MTAPTTGTYGEQGDFAADAQLEDTLVGLGMGGETPEAAKDSPETQPIPDGGPLLEEPSAEKVFKMIDGTVRRQERVAKNREEKAKHWNRVRGGVPFAYLEKNEDRSIYKASLAPGVDDVGGQPVPNKMDDLCNKIISQILADDFLPNPKPDGDGDRDRGAADLTKKFLRADGTATGTDDRQMLRDVMNMNITAASAFVMVWVDKTGGGWRPKQVNAHPQATDAAKPLYAPRLDPATGAPLETATGPIMEKTASPVLRYVAEVPNPEDPKAPPTLAFTTNAAEAARQWLPKHKRRILNINQVRTVPQSASVFDAGQIILLMYDSLGEAKKRFPVLATLPDVKLKDVCAWRPLRWKSVVPEAHRPKDADGASGGEKAITDDQLIMWYESYCRIEPDYQDGAQVCVNGAGGGFVLLRDTLRDDVELDEGETIPVLMDPPVTQFMANSDTDDCDAFGSAPLARFGGANEAWSHIWVGLFDAMHKALNLNSFIPSTSPVTREDMNRRDGTPIEVLTRDDMPVHEDPPVVPPYVPDLLERLEATINSAAGTNETSNGLDSAYSTSGVAKDISIKQARIALAQYWQNLVKGLAYYWKVKAQLAQAKLTVPQMVKLSGIDSAYKQPWFVGSDLCGVSEIALEPGSGSMMQPAEKAQYLAVLQQQAWIDPETAGELARSGMSDDLGLAPNVHEESINREIGEWSKGPPAGWEQQKTEYDAAMAERDATIQQTALAFEEQGQDPQTAMDGAAQQVDEANPPPPAPSTPFEDRPNRQEQLVAVLRHKRLSRMMSTVEYSKQPPAWRALFDQRYDEARQAAGISTVAEQQAAAQAQTDAAAQQGAVDGAAQQQDAEAGAVAKSEDVERERQFKGEQAALDRDTKLESDARKAMIAETKPTAPGRQPS